MATKKSKTTKATTDISTNQKIGLGVGLTAAAVAAAGAYFLYGSDNASKNRKQVKSWALKAKAEVLEKLEDAKEMTTAEYEQLITAVAGTYASAKGASKKDLKEFTDEMKAQWKNIEKFTKPKAKTAKKEAASLTKTATKAAAKAVVAQTAKKVVKKATTSPSKK
jgi:DNA phosphorothioation-dependent restriction protein DptG